MIFQVEETERTGVNTVYSWDSPEMDIRLEEKENENGGVRL